MEVNGQRFVRTGDKPVCNKDNKKRVVHYLINHKDVLSFEEPLSKIKTIIVYNGNDIERLKPSDLIFK
jgi:hypothetical protein